jgi:hypothetical protein
MTEENKGEWLKTAQIRTINPEVCPYLIMWPSHFRDDGTCKCNDPQEKIMRSWGYKWNPKKGRWV